MGQVGVFRVSLAACPHFMDQECAWRLNGAVQIEPQAAVFFSRMADQRAHLCFENSFLAFASAQQNDQRDGILGKLRISL